jgi:5,10-methylene-tetrahydrofolate dehydrogenase/methenyl tetrahydrofolate cyclohydrolase
VEESCDSLITAAMVKEGATVIDVGINRAPGGRLVGDLDFDGAQENAGKRGFGPAPHTTALEGVSA